MIMIKTKAKVGMIVKIDDLSTIDRFELHNERLALIINIDKSIAKLELTNKGKGCINLHRCKFSLIDKPDIKYETCNPT